MLKWQYMQDEKTHISRVKIGFFITKGVWGGAQKYVYNLATSLPKQYFDVFVVTGAGNLLKDKLEESGIRTYVIDSMKRDVSFSSEFKSLIALFKIVLKEKPKVLHLNSPKAAGLGSFVGRVLFVPKIIQTVHGFTWNEERGTLSKTLIVFFTWLTMIFAHKTIVLGKREEEQAKSLTLTSKKVILIANGIEKIDFKDKSEARKELLSKIGKLETGSETYVGTISELHKNKGLEYAIEAISKIQKPVLFFIISEGEEREKLQNLINKLGMQDRVFLLGFVSGANKYLKAFDIFTLSSIKEGLPYVILEAGLASLPVVSSALGAIPDVIENGKNGILVTPKKSGEIVRAIEYLIDNPEKQKTFGENLKNKVETEYSIERMLEKTLRLYS